MRRSPPSRLVWLLSVWACAAEAGAWCRTTTVPAQPDPLVCPAQGLPLSWPLGCVGLRLDPSVPLPGHPWAVMQRVTRDAAAAWSEADCNATADTSRDAAAPPSFRLVMLDDRAAPVGYFNDGPNSNTVALQPRWSDDPFHPPDAAAVTVVTFSPVTAEILDADTELNLEGFRFVLDDDRRGTDLQTILSHEFGHTLGLAHSAERQSVMWYAAGRGEQRRRLTADDTAGLCAIYPATRSAPCVPELRRVALEGGGTALGCGVASGSRRTAHVWLITAALLGLARRRRPFTAPR